MPTAETTTEEFVLYWTPGACVRVTLIALEEIGVSYERRLLDRSNAEEMANFKRNISPKGQVPALFVGDRLLTESPAILTYLDRRFPEAQLLPTDPDESLEALMLMSWFAGGIHPAIGRSRFPMTTTADPDCHGSIRETAMRVVRDCFGQLESSLSKDKDWLFERWTIVDAYLLWIWFRGAGSGVTGDEFPRLDELARRCQERPSVKRVLDLEAETYADLVRQGKPIPNAPMLQAGWLPATS